MIRPRPALPPYPRDTTGSAVVGWLGRAYTAVTLADWVNTWTLHLYVTSEGPTRLIGDALFAEIEAALAPVALDLTQHPAYRHHHDALVASGTDPTVRYYPPEAPSAVCGVLAAWPVHAVAGCWVGPALARVVAQWEAVESAYALAAVRWAAVESLAKEVASAAITEGVCSHLPPSPPSSGASRGARRRRARGSPRRGG